MYGEDDDFCHRAHMHGFKVGVIPSSTIFHKRTGRKPTANLWENLKRQAGYKASLIKARLKKDGRSFLLSVILWRIDHFAGKLSLLVKGHFGDMAILVLAGTIVLVNLPKIWAHRKISIKTQAFWN
jgi:GT2 family glycosyltransferase